MESIKGNNLLRKKTASIVLIWILIASGVFVLLPIFEPKAGALLYHDESAVWEDMDHGGGLDYNGDPAGDNKVTWHPAVNPHVVTSDFVVSDDYIFEIESGVAVLSDGGASIQIGQTTGATLYVNGTMASPVLMGPNGTGIWGGIILLPGSYGSIEGAWIDQPDWLYVWDATLDVNATAITNADSFGIYATGSTVTATFTAIFGTNSPGIYALNSDLVASYCFISDAQSAAIRCDNSNAMIENSDIYGYNNSAGLNGGHAIYVTGPASYMIISQNNRIIGGAGGPDSGSGGGDGGNSVFDANFNGQLSIVDNQMIMGGAGGNNFSPGTTAGAGGIGVRVIPLSDIAPSPAVNISGNTLVQGGRGGDNDALTDGFAGRGGSAIRIEDNPVGSLGDAIVSFNTDIIGGEGGHNHADYSAIGWTAGDGGEGISITGVKKPASVLVNLNPNIMGGAGGNNTGTGNFITEAGEGGPGILIWNATDVTIQSSTVTGGHGGNNTVTGVMASAGDGGNGVFPYYPNSDFSSAVFITGCTIYGGEGGDDYVGLGGPGQGGAGNGGSGIYSSQSSGNCFSSNVTGGKGGDNFGPMGSGGLGGYGNAMSSSMAWSVSGGTITGGKGGSNFHDLGGGGSGGYGVLVSGTIIASFSMVSDIAGGDGGDADVGDSGPGDAAITTIYLTASDSISFIRNDIVVGVGGYNASSGEYGTNGSFCVYTESLGGTNTFLGNDITTNNRDDNTYGIRLVLIPAGSATIEGNDIYTNQVGVFISNSDNVIVGGNNIYDNTYGVYLSSSDVTMGPNNIISNNDYGVFCDGSNPTITEDQIIDSSIVGMYFDSNSNAIVEGCAIENSDNYNVYSLGGSSPQFYNCSLNPSPGGGEFFQTGDSHPWLLNTTFDKSKTGFSGASSNITVNWYMHIQVINTTFTPVPGATVWVNDTYGANLYILSTDGLGWSKWNVVTEYIENTTGFEYYYTPHNASAWEGGRFGFTLPEMSLSRDVIIMLDGISYDLPVKQGWNMISIAVNQSSTNLEDVLSFMNGKYTAVQWFDVTDTSDPWKHYHISKDPALNDLTDIDRTMGLWVLMKYDDILSIAGPIPISPTTNIQLKTGWNYVGYPSIISRVAGNGSGEAFESISGFVDMVQYYDAADPSNQWKEWDPGVLSPDDLTDIYSGMGLWIHVTGDCTWSVDW